MYCWLLLQIYLCYLWLLLCSRDTYEHESSVICVDGIMRALCAVLCFGLVAALQPKQHPWVTENCRRLSVLLRQKQAAVRKLSAAGAVLERDKTLAPPEKLFRLHTLEVFQRELNESERSLFQAVEGLQRVMKGNLRDVVSMKDSSRQRLQALREAAIKVGDEVISCRNHANHKIKPVLGPIRSLRPIQKCPPEGQSKAFLHWPSVILKGSWTEKPNFPWSFDIRGTLKTSCKFQNSKHSR